MKVLVEEEMQGSDGGIVTDEKMRKKGEQETKRRTKNN